MTDPNCFSRSIAARFTRAHLAGARAARRLAVVVLFGSALAAVSVATAQDQAPLDRSAAETAAVAASSDVRTAELDVEAARRDLARVEVDPTTLRVARLNAQHAVEAAEDALRNARAAARDAGADAFESALQARDAVAIATTALGIARTEAEAVRIRLEAGAATESDVARADDAARAAERDVADAERSYALALDRLALRMGRTAIVAPLAEPDGDTAVPALDDVLARVGENAAVRSARRGVALAEARLAAVDVDFTSARADVEAAEDALATARLQADDLESSLTLSLRQAYNAVLAADARRQSAQEGLATADEDVDVAVVRFEAGAIAQVTLERVQLERMRRRADLHSADMALADALRALDAAVLGSTR